MSNIEFERKMNEQFAENLCYFLDKYKYTQAAFAKQMNISTATVSNWCNGLKSPRMDKIDHMCAIFSCSRSDLLEEKDIIKSQNKSEAHAIPVFDYISCDKTFYSTEKVIDTEEIPESLAKTGEFYALRIKGDSMEPKISNGDVVIVRQQDDADTGDTVIATIAGEDAVCKRLRKYKEGLELISTNPSYAPLYFDDETIKNKPVKIIGKVVELRAKF